MECLLKPENVDPLTSILLYHVVSGQVLSSALSDGQIVATLNGEDVIVDWSSRCVRSNVGDSRMNVEDEEREIGNSDRARQQAEDILGELFVVPPGLPPTVPWRVLGLGADSPVCGEEKLHDIILVRMETNPVVQGCAADLRADPGSASENPLVQGV